VHDFLLIFLALFFFLPHNERMRVSSADRLFEAMSEGVVYRRQELAAFSKAVDRDLKALLKQQRIEKPAPGLYYRPKQSRFGPLPPDQKELVRAFLKTDDFLLTSPNVYNRLGLGLTQLSNEMLVYNRKRVGKFKLGGLVYHFKRPLNFPKKTSEEGCEVRFSSFWKGTRK